jgi:hypothetical protein
VLAWMDASDVTKEGEGTGWRPEMGHRAGRTDRNGESVHFLPKKPGVAGHNASSGRSDRLGQEPMN